MNVKPNPFSHLDAILRQSQGYAQHSNGLANHPFLSPQYGRWDFGSNSKRGKVVAGVLGVAAMSVFGLAPLAYLYGSYRLLNRNCNSSLLQMYSGAQYGGGQPNPFPNLRGQGFSKFRPPTTRPIPGESYIAHAADGAPWNVNHQGATKIWNDNGVLAAISHLYASRETWLTTAEDANAGAWKARTAWSPNMRGGESRKVVFRNARGKEKKYVETRTPV